MKKTLLLSEGSITNSLIALNHFIPEFKKDFEIVFVTFAHSNKIRKRAKELGISLYEIPFYTKKRFPKEKINEEIKKIEEFIKFPINKIIFSDPEFQEIYNKDREATLSWFIKIFEIYYSLIKKHKIEAHYTSGSDHIFNFLPHFIMKALKKKTYTLIFVPYYGIILTSNFFGEFTEKKIFSKEINYKEYISPIKSKPVDYVDKLRYKEYFNLKIIDKILKIIKRDLDEKGNLYKARGNLTFGDVLLYVPKTLSTKAKISKLKRTTYKKINPKQKYVYFPLLYTEDAQIRVKYPEAYNQYELIRNISRNIPAEYKIIVKEHPVWKGQYSVKELEDLASHPNIIVVDPNISSKKIFPHIDCVITINSTVGYEALFFNKPVFVLGRPFYKNFPGIIKINSVREIFDIFTNKKQMLLKKQEIDQNLEKAVKDLLSKSLYLDYGKFLSSEETDSGIKKISLLLKGLVSKK